MNTTSQLQDKIDSLRKQLDALVAEKVYYEARLVREKSGINLLSVPPTLASLRWLRMTGDGWVLVKRNDNGAIVSLPSCLKVSFVSNSAGRDTIKVLEGIWTGLDANLQAGFLENANPNHGPVTCDFHARANGPIVIDGVSYDKQITLAYEATTVGPHPAKTDSTNPVSTGSHILEIPDYPHEANPAYGPLRTAWFRIGNSGDRYVHPGRVSAGCITCAPPYWAEIFGALIKGRRDSTSVGTVKVAS